MAQSLANGIRLSMLQHLDCDKMIASGTILATVFETCQALSPRWVGSAVAACPDDVPWQHVINAQGKISDRPGAQRQRQLLEQEGIVFVKDKVNLKVYQWRGPGREDEPWQAELGILVD